MMQALARVPLARLTHSPRAWGPLALWCALALVLAFAARQSAPGADRILLGGYGGVIVPFIAFATVSGLARDGLRPAILPMVALGASPARVALATVLTAMVVSAGLAGLLGAIVVTIAGSHHLLSDVISALWIGALGAACYASWFSLGSSFGARGAGRATFLVIDYLFGASTAGSAGATALLTPRGNLHSLLGGIAPSDVSQRASSVALVMIALVCLALSLRRAKG